MAHTCNKKVGQYSFIPGDLITAKFTGGHGELTEIKKHDLLLVVAVGALNERKTHRWHVLLHSRTLQHGWVDIHLDMPFYERWPLKEI